MGIEQDLHQLLYCHDCVIVPEWGGFVAQYRGARLDEARRLVHPPGKDIGFNRHLVRNDGLLADRIARREGIGFKPSSERIARAVADWRATLERDGRLELQHIGIFYRDTAGNLQFDPDKRANFLKDAYGLRPVAAVPVQRAAPVVRDMPPAAAVENTLGDRGTSWVWAAAASVALLLGVGSYWAWGLDDAGKERLSARLAFGNAPERTYVAPTGTLRPVHRLAGFSLPTTVDRTMDVPVPGLNGISVTVMPEPVVDKAPVDSLAVHVAKAATAVVEARFHVIGGCFAEASNADRLLDDLRAQGFPAMRLPAYGRLHPVAYGSYSNRSDALSALATIRKDGSKAAWLLVR